MNFYLDEEQLKKLAEWQSKQKQAYAGAIGGRYTYSFTPTSLGEVAEVKDHVSGESINLTDFDSW